MSYETDNSNDYDSFFIETDDGRYFACSPQSGFYFTDDASDPNVVDGSTLDIKFKVEDTIKQIASQVKLNEGTQYSRHDLFKHPHENAWLACQKQTVAKDEDDKPIKEYVPHWSRKFKYVTAISRSREGCQGNASWRKGSQSVKEANARSRINRKKKLESATEAAKKLNFNPMQQLIAWAQGDAEKLNVKDVTPAQRLKALEIFMGYAYSKPKPVDPHSQKEEQRQQGPTVNVVLPSNTREMEGRVIKHDNTGAVDEYLQKSNKEPDAFEEVEDEAGEYDEETSSFRLPSNAR